MSLALSLDYDRVKEAILKKHENSFGTYRLSEIQELQEWQLAWSRLHHSEEGFLWEVSVCWKPTIQQR